MTTTAGTNLHQTTSEQLLDTLAELGGRSVKPDDITFEGTRFIVPAAMTLMDAARFLVAKEQEELTVVHFDRTFPYRPYDGARAAAAVFRRTFGAAVQVSTMFDPAGLVTVNTSIDTTEQVPWGQITVPLLPDAVIHFVTETDPRGDLFRIVVEGPRKYRHHVDGLFALVDAELATNSLYRGKAIAGDMTFLDLRHVDPTNVTYSADVMTQLQANLWALIEHTEAMRDHGVSLKRSVLLYGPYGSGKTMAAYLTAKVAEQNGWSFHYCRPGLDDLDSVMQTAMLYQPAVVFFEDIDTLSDPRSIRAGGVSRLLDTFDGIAAKGAEVICVMTTNHVDRIHKGMIRPGRLDALIHIGHLDRNGCEVLIRNVIPDTLLDPDTDFGVVFEAMRGYLPAFVREAVDRSLRYAIALGHGHAARIGTQALVDAANGLRAQHDLMHAAEEHSVEPDSLTAAMSAVVENVVSEHAGYLAERVDDAAGSLSGDIEKAAYDIKDGTRKVIANTDTYDADGDYNGTLEVN